MQKDMPFHAANFTGDSEPTVEYDRIEQESTLSVRMGMVAVQCFDQIEVNRYRKSSIFRRKF